MSHPDTRATSSSGFTSSGGAALRFDSVGDGPPVLILHGAYSTRHETRAIFEPVFAPVDAHRRIYVDLPSMGESPAHDSIATSQAVVDLLEAFIDVEIGRVPFQLIGHSYGGHLARGLAVRRADQVAGLCVICPLLPEAVGSAPHRGVRRAGDPSEWLAADVVEEFEAYFVVHTPETAERFRVAVVPTIGRYDADRVSELMAAWRLDPDPNSRVLDMPTLIMVGRHDSLVGHRSQLGLIDAYTEATMIAVADAGHAVAHEHPDLLAAHVKTWDAQCQIDAATSAWPAH